MLIQFLSLESRRNQVDNKTDKIYEEVELETRNSKAYFMPGLSHIK